MKANARRKNSIAGILLIFLILGLALIITVRPDLRMGRRARPGEVAVKPVPKPQLPKYAMQVVKAFPFADPVSLEEWEDKIFRGKVLYKVEQEKSQSYVRARSEGAASALYYKIGIDPKRGPIMSWKWRVDAFPVKKEQENLEFQGEHDFAGRVYVIFPTLFILNSRVIEYIWAEKVPVGETGTSPYSRNIKLIVLETGPAKDGALKSATSWPIT